MSQLSALCDKRGVKAIVKYGAPANPEFPQSNPWTVTLRFGRRRLTVPFYTGLGISGEPSAADVLGCLLSDATSIRCSGGFEDWARDLGYDPDSRKAEKIYRACQRIEVKLNQFLGDEFETFAAQEH